MAWTNATTVTGINTLNDSTSATANWITYDSTVPLNIISATNVYYTTQQYNQYVTDAGTAIKMDWIQDKKVIHPQLYFKFVKSKMTKLEQKEMHERLVKLQGLVRQAEDLGQKALYEEFARKIAICVREQELNVCGIEYIVSRDSVNKFKDKVKDVDIKFKKLEEYDRPIPANVKKRLDKFKKLKMFDDYMVLYLDYKEKIDVDNKKKAVSEVKTNKQKIKEKDPILFGTLDYETDKLYFIADWVDEYCDLTLDKFIQTIKKDDPEYELERFDSIDEAYIQRMVKESRDRHDRLKKTNAGNYKKLMEEEDAPPKPVKTPLRRVKEGDTSDKKSEGSLIEKSKKSVKKLQEKSSKLANNLKKLVTKKDK